MKRNDIRWTVFLKNQHQKKVEKARLHITSCGLYEAHLDTNKIGNICLAPGITDYNKRIQYQTYDVTEMLMPGQHDFTIWLTDGWYRGSLGAWGFKNQYGTETKVLAQMEIVYEDGSSSRICTGREWKWSNDGPVRFADNKDGEIVTAERRPTYSHPAKVTSHTVVPVASNNVQVVEKERFTPKMWTTPNGKKIFDFGQNMAGYLEIHVYAEKGQKIHIRCGELLDKKGNLTLKNIQCTRKNFVTPLQEIKYICKEGENYYKTRFAVFGFQYAEVDSEVKIEPEDITAIAVYSDMKQTGFLSTPLILSVLEEYDLDAAYRLLENEKMPGWLFMPKNGATTIWESWEGTAAQGDIASLNHYLKGAVCEWLFKSMCGIQIAGENHFRIEPKPGGSFTYVKAKYNSVYGKVESGWRKEKGKWIFDIEIPANCMAKICLPGEKAE